MYKIMIVEDDDKIAGMTIDKLRQYNYQVYRVNNYLNIKKEFIEIEPDLVLLDINLPNYDGFYWCREIRKISKVPIVFVSARFSDMDQVMAIENGGDDYIIKPFSFEVLLAKIKGVIRRTYGEYKLDEKTDILDIDGLILYRSQSIVEYESNQVELSKNEVRLLNIFMENINEIVSREKLLEELWDDTNFVDDNTLSVNITRLRRRLSEVGISDGIETKRGQGYVLINNWR